MSTRAVNLGAPEWFTLESQADDDAPTRFKVRGLSGYEQASIAADISLGPKGTVNFSAAAILYIFKVALDDWENVEDADGKPIDFQSITPRRAMDLLHYNIQAEIAAHVFELSFASAADKKK